MLHSPGPGVFVFFNSASLNLFRSPIIVAGGVWNFERGDLFVVTSINEYVPGPGTFFFQFYDKSGFRE